MSRSLILTVGAALVGLLMPGLALAQPKHPRLHEALYEMREAHKELKEASNTFGGHKEKALEALDAAIRQTEKALEAVGDPYKSFTPAKGVYEPYKDFKHLRHGLDRMRIAVKELRDAQGNFGGHRDAAVKDLEIAITQVEKCINSLK
jgi:hypothetical protein